MPIKSIGPALETRQSHTIEYGVSKIVPVVRFCSEEAHKYTDVQPVHRVYPALAPTVQVEHH